MNIKKIKYLLTPPIVPKIFEKYFHNAKEANSITSSENTIEEKDIISAKILISVDVICTPAVD